MLEELTDRINEYSAITIKLASPEEIRSWSNGEVKKPETINYRTFKPEKDGLFCEKIFGPERDWECTCGRYKGIKYKGLVCDRCGVQITRSYERRKRMGHINLAAPVAHIWFFKTIPSRMAAILDMKITELERVIYYQNYVVTEIRDAKCGLKERTLLQEEGEDGYRRLKERYRDAFDAEMGAEAILNLLGRIKLRELSEQLREKLALTTSEQKYKDLVKRLITVEKFLESGNKADWMVLTVVPVIPPDLRPLVLLESGTFATSDLNDLYRRLINRNNRLKKLMELNAPEVIIRNEKRMLQQAVDALLDNTRCRRAVLGANNRPLKSLADIIKGKQGRFRENLLGKRVDYSARSVVVVGPELKLSQCGLPKRIALEIYQPFIIRKLKDSGVTDSAKSAKKILERKDDIVWDVLDQVIKDHPVLLNRAPTLHRMGIQAFYPILVEGNAIRLHPLVCGPFNADFDGDQMAVHLPLSFEAQIEARTLMMSTENIFSPSHGNPSISPSQDMVLGLAYLTHHREELQGEGKVFSCEQEAIQAFETGKIALHAMISVRTAKSELGAQNQTGAPHRIKTTVGRVMFNETLPAKLPYYNINLDKKEVQRVISDVYKICGKDAVVKALDDIKMLGFRFATKSGISFSKDDLKIPEEKWKIIKNSMEDVQKIEDSYKKGAITPGERYSHLVDAWISAREKVTEAMMHGIKNDTRDGKPYLNPIHLMVSSGARGSQDQVRQLAGMRGLMARPSGKIIETPILSNFREGLNVLEYFSSTHGARKGLADTALKTADAGYLTRRLVDVCQDVFITMHDCGTLAGITKTAIYRGSKIEVHLWQAIYGRVVRDNIVDIVTDEVIIKEDELITESIAKKIEELGYTKIRVRSPFTCEASQGLCVLCYGMDLSTGILVEEGLAVGIIAAQSIGEPGTQLTMRTFHIGGVAIKASEEPKYFAKSKGVVKFSLVQIAELKGQRVITNRNSEIIITDEKDRELERFQVPVGAVLRVTEGEKVKQGTVIAEWDPHNIPIVSSNDGSVVFDDIVKGRTLIEEKDPRHDIIRRIVIEHRDLHPQIVVKDPSGKTLEFHPVPEKAHLEVEEGQKVKAGTVLAKTPREVTGTQDITGGLPRVTELFEARRPKEPAVISKIDGVVDLGEKKRGKRVIWVVNPDTKLKVPHDVPYRRHLRVRSGDHVKSGDPLVEGPLIPKDILEIKGEEAVQQYLLQEVEGVYRSQNAPVNDKHVEIIISQMMRKVRIQNPGNSKFLRGMIVDKYRVRQENTRLKKLGKKTATFQPLLLGVSKAAIQSESFISAASFQETTKVLTDAAISGKKDELLGLKENVIAGHLIPAGTGFKKYTSLKLDYEAEEVEEEAVVEQIS